MIAAIILTAYRNITGKEANRLIHAAIERASTLAGGACAFLGVCGAAAGAGIALSVTLECDPCKVPQRQQVQQFTASILQSIAQHRAARCCQRDCWTALKAVSNLSTEYFGVHLPAEETFQCHQHNENKECLGSNCPLWPNAVLNPPASPRLSIIIPALNEYDRINDTIEQLRRSKAEGDRCEIIVVDGDPQATTIRAIKDKTVRTTVSLKGRGTQMNAGAKIARGDIIIFLHADTTLPQGAVQKICKTLESEEFVAGAFDLGIDSSRAFLKWIAARASSRSRLSRIPYGDQAIFIRRTYFEKVGGYREIPVMEDVDLMCRIKKRGDRISILHDKVVTSARRWETEGPIYTTLRNQILLGLYYLGVNPERLSRFYKICGNGSVKKKG